MALSMFSSFLVVHALLSTASVSGLVCFTCKEASSNEECIAKRVSTRCHSSATICSNMTTTLLNTTTGKTRMSITKECTYSQFCDNAKAVCEMTINSVKPPMNMTACSYTCCSSGPDCVNVTGETTPTAPTSTTVERSTSAPTTTKLPAAYTASLWTTDMSLCKQKCCGGTPGQIWQNRSCCPVSDGGCLSVALAREVKCEDTYCNQQHCGACQFCQRQLMIMIVAIVSVLYNSLL